MATNAAAGTSLRVDRPRSERDTSYGSIHFTDDDINSDNSNEEREDISDEKILSGGFESLDYDHCENELFQQEERKSSKAYIKKEVVRWLVFGLIGILTGLIACVIDNLVILSTKLKFTYIKNFVDSCVDAGESCLQRPFLIWVCVNAGLVFLGAFMTAVIEPVAAGSGIPQIKCFLNGVKVPHVVRIKTLICKVLGVICAVGGGLVVGKEGPMIHSGAVVAAGISQGKSDTFHVDFKILQYFRSDKEKRDFVSGGAAAGVSAAFGAPVGGVLFSLEEGASFWNQALTWRIFFASMLSTFSLNIVQSYVKGTPWSLSSPGLFNFGKFDTTDYSGLEIPLFILMGVFGGFLGAAFNHINYKLTIFRKKYIKTRGTQVTEAILVAIATATVSYLTLYFNNDCQPMRKDPDEDSVQFFCDDGQYSANAGLMFHTPEESIKELFHDIPGTFRPATLAVYCLCSFFLACWTYGLYVPSGLFIPSILIGASWGRLLAVLLKYFFPSATWVNYSKYALLGGAAQLGGIVRMTISLTVIITEATGNITLGLPVMIVLMVSKWIGDIFNEGIYDMHVHLQGVPLLGWEPSIMLSNISATELMSHPVTVLRSYESVGRIVDILKNETHNGFPVVEDYDPFTEESPDSGTFGTFHGTILRSQLIILLKLKVFEEHDDVQQIKKGLSIKDFRDAYPRFTPIHQIHISPQERNFHIDLKSFLNPGAYSVSHCASFPRIFRLFRALGLRHVVVVNRKHQVIGMVTRKDLARYRITQHFGKVNMEELPIAK
ncbi:H(+)/Cl(-) exchange transporter 7-like [Pecten maximus]|uniref:H(+)/Cl(-) exchange transporter 7-like n=1 Tax=Pecten maximus TaxID=6579 RepID=UPI0014591028|nr:H(+)/Cl(-) exchange transporter 7-like [Pecten maximus]